MFFLLIAEGFVEKTGSDNRVVFLKIASSTRAEVAEERCNPRQNNTDQDTMWTEWTLDTEMELVWTHLHR